MKKNLLSLITILIISNLQAQKMEFYAGGTYFYMPKSVAEKETKTIHIIPFEKDTFASRKTYFNTAYDSLVFKNKVALNIGVLFQKPLSNKFSLSYGLGINYLAFNQTYKSEFSNKQARVEIDTISHKENNSTEFTYIFVSGFNNYPSIKEGTDYTIFELQAPVLLKYKFSEEVYANFGLSFNVPFAVKSRRERLNIIAVKEDTTTTYDFEKVVDINRKPKSVRNFSADATFEYQKWFNHFGMAITAKYRLTNFWAANNNDDDIAINSYSQKIIKKHNVHPIFVEFKVLYRL